MKNGLMYLRAGLVLLCVLVINAALFLDPWSEQEPARSHEEAYAQADVIAAPFSSVTQRANLAECILVRGINYYSVSVDTAVFQLMDDHYWTMQPPIRQWTYSGASGFLSEHGGESVFDAFYRQGAPSGGCRWGCNPATEPRCSDVRP